TVRHVHGLVERRRPWRSRLVHLPPPGTAPGDRPSLPDPSRSALARDRRHLDGWSGSAALRGNAARLLRLRRGVLRRLPRHAIGGPTGRPGPAPRPQPPWTYR